MNPLRLSPRRAGALAAASLAVLAGFLGRGRFHRSDPTPFLADLTLERRADGAYVSDRAGLTRVAVVSVVDGDTIRVRWEGKDERLRYYGVNTPEQDEACYEEAARRNAELSGKEVLLAFDERPRDKYERLLAYVFTPEGKSIDAALVAEGVGRAWTRNGRWRGQMESLEKDARGEHRGCLWAEKRKTTPPRRRRAKKRR